MIILEDLKRIAEIEFSDIVENTDRIGSKLRVLLRIANGGRWLLCKLMKQIQGLMGDVVSPGTIFWSYGAGFVNL